MTNRDLVALLARKLRDSIGAVIPRDRPVALVGFPDTANCGDHAMWLGEKALLAALGLSIAYECSLESYDAGAMREKLGDGAILVHGGGSFGDRYPAHDAFRARLVADFPGNRIIFLPLQVTYLDDSHLERAAAGLSPHGEVILFARSALAEQQLRRYFGARARVELAPDTAFMLGPKDRPTEPLYDIVWLARTDENKGGDQTEAAARLSSQAAEKYVLPRFPDGIEINFVVKQRPPTILLTDWFSLFFENVEARLAYAQLGFDQRSEAYVSRALYILSLGRLIITDRLHGHILCLLLGIPHILLNNESGKNWNFYETWTRDSPLCRLARNSQEAWLLARSAVVRLKEGSGDEWSWQAVATSAP